LVTDLLGIGHVTVCGIQKNIRSGVKEDISPRSGQREMEGGVGRQVMVEG